MKARIRKLTLRDHVEMLELWRSCEGLGVTESDSREGIRAFLRRNPGHSFVAVKGGHVIGTALCGHDGRRGFIYHLAVAGPERRQGVAGALIEACLKKLARSGIPKCHIVVYARNDTGRNFWKRTGWVERVELKLMSRLTG